VPPEQTPPPEVGECDSSDTVVLQISSDQQMQAFMARDASIGQHLSIGPCGSALVGRYSSAVPYDVIDSSTSVEVRALDAEHTASVASFEPLPTLLQAVPEDSEHFVVQRGSTMQGEHVSKTDTMVSNELSSRGPSVTFTSSVASISKWPSMSKQASTHSSGATAKTQSDHSGTTATTFGIGELVKRTAACRVDPDVMRSVPVHKILGDCGKVFLSNVGNQDTYHLSQLSEDIDHFWSHSWSAKSVHKICTLLLFYNGTKAAVASILTAIGVALLMQFGIIPGSFCQDWGCDSHADCSEGFCDTRGRCLPDAFCCQDMSTPIDGTCPYDCYGQMHVFYHWPVPAAFFVYVVVLIKWRPRVRAFLDKVCINQVDPEKKRRGIEGLGGFLRKTKEFVLLWDASYATRLWCTFELAAFLHLSCCPKFSEDWSSVESDADAQAAPWDAFEPGDADPQAAVEARAVSRREANISVQPCMRGYTILIAMMSTLVVLTIGVAWPYVFVDDGMVVWAWWTSLMMGIMVWIVGLARAWARDRFHLYHQLKNFSVDRAECWCCKVNHINPVDGQIVGCDRQLICRAIDTWFSGGQIEFETMVRETLTRQVDNKMSGMLRFRDAVYIGLPMFWFEISKMGADCPSAEHLGRRLLVTIATCLSWNTLTFGVVMFLCSLVCRKRKHCDWCVTLVTGVICTVASLGINELFKFALWSHSEWYISISGTILGAVLAKLLLNHGMSMSTSC